MENDYRRESRKTCYVSWDYGSHREDVIEVAPNTKTIVEGATVEDVSPANVDHGKLCLSLIWWNKNVVTSDAWHKAESKASRKIA